MAGIISTAQQQTATGNASRGYLDATNDTSVVPANMYGDYQNFWKSTPVGGTANFGGGTLTRLDNPGVGGAQSDGGQIGMYTDASGKQYPMGSWSNLADVANANPGIAAQWKSQYGYNPNGAIGSNTGDPTSGGGIIASAAGAPTSNTSTDATQDVTKPLLVGSGATSASQNTAPAAPAATQTATPQTTASSTTAPNAAPTSPTSQMSQDWLNGFKPGTQSQSWGGGTLSAVDANGNRVFTPADGKQTTVNANTNMADLARNNQGVAAQWQSQYGYKPDATASTYTASQLNDPTKWGITADQTVQGQLSHMMDPNNPMYQQWMTQGKQAAAASGILNGSMAQTAMQDSLMRNATPIATADANTFAKAAGYNADEQNVFSVANQNAGNTASQFNSGQANQMAQANLSAETQKYVSTLSSTTQSQIAKMNNDSQQLVSREHDANATLIANNGNAQTAYNSYVAAVAQIDQNDKMDGPAKGAAIQHQTDIYNAAMGSLKTTSPNTPVGTGLQPTTPAAAQVGNVDVGNLLNFNVDDGGGRGGS
jgi:hypothetical protein